MASTDADVCVIGGGPAGSSFALRLAQLGHDVILIERDVFPRPHVGEAFSAGIHVPLAVLGVAQDVYRAGVLETRGTLRSWAQDGAERVAPATGRPGLTVDRGVFDRVLLDRARASGVRVLQPARAVGVERTGGRWTLGVRGAASTDRVRARFLADASGRAGGLRRASHEAPNPAASRAISPATTAMAGYWRRRSAPDQDVTTYLEAAPDCWYWGAPLPGHGFVGMVFSDPGRRGSTPRDARYLDLIRQSTLLTEALSGAALERVVVRDATCRAVADPIGETWIRLGEASFSIDPLSSAGVQKAIQTALTGAIVVHTQLACADRADVAMMFYRDDRRCGIEQHARWAAAACSEVERFRERPFWRRRAAVAPPSDEPPPAPTPAPGQRVRVARDTRLVPVPCIVGNLIEMRMAVAHPRLDRPVAFLDDVAIAPLVGSIREGATDAEIVARWAPVVPSATGRAVARWLIARGILVEFENDRDNEP